MFNINFSSKIKEAEEHIHQGEKYLKTSFLKWKPDLDSAIDEFDKACNCYRVAEKYEQCRDLSLRLAELQIQKGNWKILLEKFCNDYEFRNSIFCGKIL
jgi:hypothetical protein